uniref:Uncharacterized protein n=1 Tax=Medicago truncatula TaxID=3880 RepID=A2Q2X3_MEDTR|nr:hypothetical protein MtrDRAFT_AC152185g40v2 [Medicago truncatula]
MGAVMLSPMKFVIDKTFVQPGFNNDLPPLQPLSPIAMTSTTCKLIL